MLFRFSLAAVCAAVRCNPEDVRNCLEEFEVQFLAISPDDYAQQCHLVVTQGSVCFDGCPSSALDQFVSTYANGVCQKAEARGIGSKYNASLEAHLEDLTVVTSRGDSKDGKHSALLNPLGDSHVMSKRSKAPGISADPDEPKESSDPTKLGDIYPHRTVVGTRLQTGIDAETSLSGPPLTAMASPAVSSTGVESTSLGRIARLKGWWSKPRVEEEAEENEAPRHQVEEWGKTKAIRYSSIIGSIKSAASLKAGGLRANTSTRNIYGESASVSPVRNYSAQSFSPKQFHKSASERNETESVDVSQGNMVFSAVTCIVVMACGLLLV